MRSVINNPLSKFYLKVVIEILTKNKLILPLNNSSLKCCYSNNVFVIMLNNKFQRLLMQLSNTSQYAIRVLAYITNKKDSELTNAMELAESLTIPYKFLTKIMAELVKADLVKSIRGRDGGYRLKRSASAIMVDDVLNLFNDSIRDEQCVLGIGFCDNSCKCALHDQWMEPKLLMQRMFRESSLEDIAGRGCKI